jgi:hypothetical protein
MKIVSLRRAVVARMACPQCYEPARACPPRMWVAANGPRPLWSHVDGEPLCPVIGAGGYRPARRPCLVVALRPAEYEPRLHDRLCLEQCLAEDAAQRGWPREVERHNAIAKRIAGLLDELAP